MELSSRLSASARISPNVLLLCYTVLCLLDFRNKLVFAIKKFFFPEETISGLECSGTLAEFARTGVQKKELEASEILCAEATVIDI